MPPHRSREPASSLCIELTGDSLRIHHQIGEGKGCAFFLVCLVAWTFGIVKLFPDAWRDGEMLPIGFMILVWLIMFAILMWDLLAREALVFTELEFIHERRAGVRLSRRTSLLSRIERLEVLPSQKNDKKSMQQYEIRVFSPDLEVFLRPNFTKDSALSFCDLMRNLIEIHAKTKLDPPHPSLEMIG